ncbi:MAG: ABC transporter ATP-binding protein [Dehalococcoidia bacterium]
MLAIRGVHLSYNGRPVLQGVSLEVERGELVGLVGPNGAGKTTLLRTISGVLRAQRGNITLGGQRLAALAPRERARLVAVVSQNPAIAPGFTALELVLMGRNPHLGLLQWEGPRDLAAARRAMELTDTWELAKRQVVTLSGGERQRVFMARALAQKTPLLLLDEPTAHLDIAYQAALFDLVQEVRAQTGITVLAAIHDLTLAGQYCDRIGALHQGRIVALGRPREVLTPQTIATVFGAQVAIVSHPVAGSPAVLPVGRMWNQQGHL